MAVEPALLVDQADLVVAAVAQALVLMPPVVVVVLAAQEVTVLKIEQAAVQEHPDKATPAAAAERILEIPPDLAEQD
jgi:hypothetical protein